MDLYVTHLNLQLNRLYRNWGEQGFDDETLSSKLGYATYHLSGFGTRFLDFDNDGARDLFVANGELGRIYGAQWCDWRAAGGGSINQIDRVISLTLHHYQRIDVWINNAGHGLLDSVSDVDMTVCR